MGQSEVRGYAEGDTRTFADAGVPQVSVGVRVVEGRALVAVPAHRIVLSVFAHAPAHVARRHVHGRVEVAGVGVPVTLAP